METVNVIRGQDFFNRNFNNFLTKFYWKHKYPKKFLEYEKFKNKIENKRVCIVGPAEYINKEFENHGKTIDSYDVIVRVNNFINMDESLYQNYGKRTDILVTSLFAHPYATCFHEETYSKEKIIRPLVIFYHYGRLRKFYFSYFLKNENITICGQPKKNFNELKKLTKHPTAGIIAIFEIAKCNPKELLITGFTFGKDEKYSSYVDKYHKYNPELDKRKDKMDYAGVHHIASEFNITRDLILKNKNIFVDNYLSKVIFGFNDSKI
jgi:hypothetical protein